MRDRSKKKAATISTKSAVASHKMKKPVQSPESSQVIPEKTMAAAAKKTIHHTSNPLKYIFDRQVNDKFDHCKRLVAARFLNSQNLFRKDLYAHFGCVNAIEFSKQGNMLISGQYTTFVA